jgi:hypothetical protein
MKSGGRELDFHLNRARGISPAPSGMLFADGISGRRSVTAAKHFTLKRDQQFLALRRFFTPFR